MINWLISFSHSLFAFVVILVPLVVFHEFGHYVFAQIFGVKAEIFSVGFGPKLFSYQKGETEWRLSAIPMGGYVKLLGEDRDSPLSPEDQKRSLHRQKAWKRFFIFLGGPLFNFILAIFIFMVILAIGEPQISNVIGRIVKGSPAEVAGLRSSDQVLSIDGEPIRKFEEMMVIVTKSPGKILHFQVVHSAETSPVTLNVPVTEQSGFTIYGEPTHVGDIEGLMPMGRGALIGISDPSSLAAQQGMETGDRILSVNDQKIANWEYLETLFKGISAKSFFLIQFEKGKSKEKKTAKFEKGASDASLSEAFGLYSSELFVEKVLPKSPAESNGIMAGDRLVGIGTTQVQSFFELKDAVQKTGEKERVVTVHWERNGKKFQATVEPTGTEHRDPLLNKMMQYTIGVVPMLEFAEPATVVERVWNPFKLVYMATDRMVSFSWKNLVSLRKMISGTVSVGTLGGPLMIGKIAGESLTRGLIAFLTNMAIFSIGLGVLNILPVPVLDGGHLLLLGIESIRGKPLSLRQLEIVQGVGLICILALMAIAFSNDIARLFYS